jgi:glucuronate isomerase
MNSLENTLFHELDSVTLVDSHSHINPREPAAKNLADLLGYHYYTELVHSAGMPREQIEQQGLSAKDKVERLFQRLHEIDHTVQWDWFLDIGQDLLDLPRESIVAEHWEQVFDRASDAMQRPDWTGHVLRQSKVERIFLTNDFDDRLDDFDTHRYIPCLRTDDLVFHLHLERTGQRLESASGIAVHSLSDVHQAIGQLFQYFKKNGAKACAISLPPWFSPHAVSLDDPASTSCWQRMRSAPHSISEDDRRTLANWVFWRLAEFCVEYRLPFDLMIGVNRRVYPGGVYQGQDLYDSRWSMIQYSELFNAFPTLKFPISVLASVSNQELVDYAWIFPNVLPHGHWWYSNTPSFIEHDLKARIDAVPRNKLLGYYSDAYKLEFILPKYRMYKKILAKILAQSIVIDRGKSESFAVALGQQILRGNVDSAFLETNETKD